MGIGIGPGHVTKWHLPVRARLGRLGLVQGPL